MIVILTQCFPSRIGGIENLMFNLSYFLSKENKVIVLADQHNLIKDTVFFVLPTSFTICPSDS